jgi:hypothetical protein
VATRYVSVLPTRFNASQFFVDTGGPFIDMFVGPDASVQNFPGESMFRNISALRAAFCRLYVSSSDGCSTGKASTHVLNDIDEAMLHIGCWVVPADGDHRHSYLLGRGLTNRLAAQLQHLSRRVCISCWWTGFQGFSGKLYTMSHVTGCGNF